MDDWDVSCAFSEFKLTRLKSVSVSRQSLFSRLWHGGQWYYHLIGQDRNIPPLERETPLGLIARYYPEGKKLGTFKTHLPSESFFLNLILKYDYARYFRSIRVGATGLSTEISVNELVSNFVTVLLYVFYLSLICHLTRSDSTDCKRIPREENTYCNRLHYQKLLVHFFSLWRIPDHNSSMQTAIFFSLKLYPSRASSWCILFSYYCKGLINN